MNEQLKNFYNQTQRTTETSLSEQSKERVKTKIFANLGAQIIEPESDSWTEKFKGMFFRTYVIIPLVCLLFVVGSTSVSAGAIPGDKLYGVKRSVEEMQVLVAPTEEAKLQLQIHFAERRIKEDEKLNEDIKPNTQPQSITETPEVKVEQKIEEPQRKIKSEANEAFNFVKEAEKKYRTKGKEQKAKDLEERFKKYQERYERTLNGQVNGAKIENNKDDSERERNVEQREEDQEPEQRDR